MPTAHGRYRPPPTRTPARRQASPTRLLNDLAALLYHHGLTHIYGQATTTEGVLSIAYGITVWTNGTTLHCHTPNGTHSLPTSIHAAARHLTNLANLPPRHRTQPPDPRPVPGLPCDPPGNPGASP
jgi:hypothetical protein